VDLTICRTWSRFAVLGGGWEVKKSIAVIKKERPHEKGVEFKPELHKGIRIGEPSTFSRCFDWRACLSWRDGEMMSARNAKQ
jgi:hypothetical protein